ncbi:MAG: ATP-binding protein [Phycisphaerae bacterium]|nr:ATP-binding protein [Phycisphaerae bacterium]
MVSASNSRLCVCGGTIARAHGANGWGFWPQRCPACDARFERERIRRDRIERTHAIQARITFIPPRYQAARLAHVPGKLATSLLGGGCYVWGPTGCGKTHALYGLARYLAIRHGGTVFMSFDGLLRELREGFDTRKSESAILRRYERARYLLLDDVAAGSDSVFAARVMLAVLDYRHNHLLPTYFSANVPPEKIKAVYGERVFSRLVGTCSVIRLGGEDRRLERQAAKTKEETHSARCRS